MRMCRRLGIAVSVARRWVGKAERKRVRCTVSEGLRCGWDSNALSSWIGYVEEGEERGRWAELDRWCCCVRTAPRAATHWKPAVNSGHYRVPKAQDGNTLSTFQETQNLTLIISDKDDPRFKSQQAHHGSPRSDRVSPPGRTTVEGPPAALGRDGAAHARAVGQRPPNADEPRPRDSGRGRQQADSTLLPTCMQPVPVGEPPRTGCSADGRSCPQPACPCRQSGRAWATT